MNIFVFIKFGFPFAGAMTIFAWGMLDSRAGFERAGQWSFAIDALRWGTDYMIRVKSSFSSILYNTVREH